MAVVDPNRGQQVRNVYGDNFYSKVVDGQSGATPTKILNVVNDGDTVTAGTNDAGNPTMFKGIDGKHHEGLSDSQGRLLVAVQPAAGSSSVCDYLAFTGATTMVPATTVGGTVTAQTHAKAVTASKTAMGIKVSVASAGLIKWDIGTNNGTTFTVLKTVITSPARPTYDISIAPSNATAPGTGTFSIQVNGTNIDAGAVGVTADGYSTFEWTEM